MVVSKVVSVHTIKSGFENTFESDFVFPGEQHDFWEFVYVIDGCLEVVKDEKVYVLESGQMTFYAPSVFHGIRSAKGTCPHIIIMSFLLTGNGHEKLGNGVFDVTEKEKSIIFSALSYYNTCLHSNDNLKLQFAAIKLEELMLDLLENQTPRTTPQKNTGSQNYRMIVNTLEQKANDNLTAEQIADCCGMSLSNLKKTFKRYSGIGLMNYYNNIRITRAKSLIQQGKSMLEVSQLLNYSSQYYFTVSFKRYMHMTPTEYKKKMLEEK